MSIANEYEEEIPKSAITVVSNSIQNTTVQLNNILTETDPEKRSEGVHLLHFVQTKNNLISVICCFLWRGEGEGDRGIKRRYYILVVKKTVLNCWKLVQLEIISCSGVASL